MNLSDHVFSSTYKPVIISRQTCARLRQTCSLPSMHPYLLFWWHARSCFHKRSMFDGHENRFAGREKHHHHITNTSPSHRRNIAETSLEHCQNIANTSLGHRQIIIQILIKRPTEPNVAVLDGANCYCSWRTQRWLCVGSIVWMVWLGTAWESLYSPRPETTRDHGQA